MTEEEFAGKIHWEGGVLDAVEYGLKHTDLPDGDLKEAWLELEIAWSAVSSLVDEIYGLLPDVGGS